MKFYTDEDIIRHYKMKDAIHDVTQGLDALNNNLIKVKERTVINAEEDNVMLYMPAINLQKQFSAIKVISIFPDNPAHNLPTSQGVTLLTELATGKSIAALEASYLTRLRTGAMTGIATNKLARRDAHVLGVIGTGGMAFEQVLGVLEVRKIDKILLFNRTEQKAHQFKEKLVEFGVTAEIEIVSDVDTLTKQADIINCATKSEQNVYQHMHLKVGTHVNGVGSYLPHMREIDIDTIEQAAVIAIDDVAGAEHEAGEFIHASHAGRFNFSEAIELKDLINMDITREDTDFTVFKSVGAAYYDLFVAIGAYEKLK